MARLFDRAEVEAAESVALSSTPGGRSAARTLAVAVAALLVSLLVVSRSTTALGGEAASLGNQFGPPDPPAAAGTAPPAGPAGADPAAPGGAELEPEPPDDRDRQHVDLTDDDRDGNCSTCSSRRRAASTISASLVSRMLDP